MSKTTNALGAIRVLDLSTTISGPYCARLLADVGMDVIKIEPPGGENLRRLPPVRDGVSSSYGHLNAGKRSIELDLKSRAGADAFRRLILGAEILVENYRPGVMQRLGLTYESLKALKPDLIYCAISGYGQTGPSASLPAYAPVIHASSGYDLAHLDSQPGRSKPDACGVMIADYLSGTYAFGAIMTALSIRDRTGAGQMIDVSMLESMLTVLMPEVQGSQFELLDVRQSNGPMQSGDGYIMVSFPGERGFDAMVRATGREDWRTDPRFADGMDRRRNWSALRDEVEDWTRAHTTAECQAAFDAAGVPCSSYRVVKDVLTDPQIAHRGSLSVVSDAVGTYQVTNPPFRLSGHRASVGERVSAVGEYTEAVLRQIGMSDGEIKVVLPGSADRQVAPPAAQKI